MKAVLREIKNIIAYLQDYVKLLYELYINYWV